MAQLFGFGGSSIVINIKLNGDDERPKGKLLPQDPNSPMVGIYAGSDHVSGIAEVVVPPNKRVEHLGAKVELIGQIDLLFDKSNSVKFTTVVKELESAGTMFQSKTFPFEFNVEKAYETYSGVNVRLRYFVRVTITRQYKSNIIKEQDIIVRNVTPAPATTETKTNEDGTLVPAQPPGIKMEVGIEECLHIEFEFDKQKYHLKDVILGKIYFILVRIKIKHMELAIIRRESSGSGPNTYNESETITKFELMDGAPVKGEVIPIRLFLSPLELTPTYRSVCGTFSVKYFLNLVLIDEEDRRYFKQQEVTFWREK